MVLARVLAAIAGGYVFCWGFIAVGIAGLVALGMPFEDAEHLASILVILAYLVVFLWAFAARSVLKLWTVLACGGIAMAALASLLQARLLT